MIRIIVLILSLPLSFVFAQTDSTVNKPLSLSFSDVDENPIKRYCTQKVLNQTPNRFISIGYEYQGGFDYKQTPSASSLNESLRFDNASGMRLGFYTPIVSKNNLIVNLAGNYWRTAFNGTNISSPNSLYQSLNNNGLQSAGLSFTVFKPLNEKKFLLFQASADANWQLQSSGLGINKKALTYSGSVLYGWKPTENLMWGIGVSRTYRLGRPIIIPIVLYNQTFNDKWGIESVFPAKVAIRRNINKKSMLFAGYELEGNQYAIYNTSVTGYLQRGEIKTRLTYERSLFGFWWISIQSGIRTNGRFNVVNQYNGGKDNEFIKTTLGNAFYFNVSINLVSL